MLDTTKYLFLGTHQNEPKQLPNLLVIVYQLNVLNNNFTFMDYPLLMHGELTFVHHNEIRDIKAEWLDCVCHDVVVKPPLQPLSLRVRMLFQLLLTGKMMPELIYMLVHGCWGHVFDIRVFLSQYTKLPQLQYLCCV